MVELADTRALRAREAKHFVRVRPPPSAPTTMEQRIHDTLEYYIHGELPRVLLLSGMHGDEYEAGELLELFVKNHYPKLPDFLFIPRVSPSAVNARTRKNAYGHDINRQFIDTTDDPEARRVMSLLKQFSFDLCIDVHEDPDRTMGFYLYDSDQMTDEELATFRAIIHPTGARLYTGVDDVDDENLNLYVEKGYVSLGFEKSEAVSGFSSRWLYEENRCKRSFTTEIPGKGPRELKTKLIHSVVSFLLSAHLR